MGLHDLPNELVITNEQKAAIVNILKDGFNVEFKLGGDKVFWRSKLEGAPKEWSGPVTPNWWERNMDSAKDFTMDMLYQGDD